MELTDADRRMFEGRNYGHLATLMPDGSPQVSPVWVDIDARTGLILVNTAAGRRKLRNVERDPRVAISVTDSDDQENMVTVRGRVVEITTDGAEDHIDFLSRKYNGVEFPRHGNRVLLRIEADHVARDR